MAIDRRPARKQWQWIENRLRWELHVGVLSLHVMERNGRWWVGRLEIFTGPSFSTKEEAFEEAEERAFCTGMRILLELPGS